VPNLLVVSAGYRGWNAIVENVSTRGIEVADLVADGSHPEAAGKFATSYAAPRASAAAAQIALEFPQLTPQQIKLALLLGAQIQADSRNAAKNRFLDVRSGGFLNVEGARSVATRLARHSAALSDRQSALTTLCQTHCGGEAAVCQLPIARWDHCGQRAQERLDRLVETEILKF
jgi:hypothetical protein